MAIIYFFFGYYSFQITFTAICPEARPAAALILDPRPPRHRQDRDLCQSGVPVGAARHRHGAGVRPFQHRRGPAHRENSPHRPEGGAGVRQVQGGHQLARLFPVPPQSDQEPHGLRGAQEAPATEG